MLDVLGFFINLSNETKMCIRLFMPPTLLFVLGLIIQFFGNFVYELAQSYSLSIIGSQVTYYLDWFSLLVIALALLGFIWQTYRLWQWENGKADNFCHVCGGIVTLKEDGKWGDYYKCLACSNNRSIR